MDVIETEGLTTSDEFDQKPTVTGYLPSGAVCKVILTNRTVLPRLRLILFFVCIIYDLSQRIFLELNTE